MMYPTVSEPGAHHQTAAALAPTAAQCTVDLLLRDLERKSCAYYCCML
jgi:hypothetical protein